MDSSLAISLKEERGKFGALTLAGLLVAAPFGQKREVIPRGGEGAMTTKRDLWLCTREPLRHYRKIARCKRGGAGCLTRGVGADG